MKNRLIPTKALNEMLRINENCNTYVIGDPLIVYIGNMIYLILLI